MNWSYKFTDDIMIHHILSHNKVNENIVQTQDEYNF